MVKPRKESLTNVGRGAPPLEQSAEVSEATKSATERLKALEQACNSIDWNKTALKEVQLTFPADTAKRSGRAKVSVGLGPRVAKFGDIELEFNYESTKAMTPGATVTCKRPQNAELWEVDDSGQGQQARHLVQETQPTNSNVDATPRDDIKTVRKANVVVNGVERLGNQAYLAQTEAAARLLARTREFEKGTGESGRVGQINGVDVYMSNDRDALYGRDRSTGQVRHLAGDSSVTKHETAKYSQQSSQDARPRGPDIEMG